MAISDYPGAFDTFHEPNGGEKTENASSALRHSTLHQKVNAAIEALQATLGINPQGADTTVAQRLSDIENDIQAGTGVATVVAGTGISVNSSDSANPIVSVSGSAFDPAGTAATLVTAHILDTTDAHDATAVSYAGGVNMSATNVEAAIDELAAEKAQWLGATYTPTLANVAIGTGGTPVNSALYRYVGGPSVGDMGIMYVTGSVILGTTSSSVTNIPRLTIPSGFNMPTTLTVGTPISPVGFCRFVDSSASNAWIGVVYMHDATQVAVHPLNASGTYASESQVSSTVPFTWAASDRMDYNYSIPVTRV